MFAQDDTQGCKNTHKFDTWQFNQAVPNKVSIKDMYAESIEVATRLLMNNHIYKFHKHIRVQENKRSIVVEFTGIAIEMYMLIWCKKTPNDCQTRIAPF